MMAQIKSLEGTRSRPIPMPIPAPKPDVSAPAFLQAITPEGWMLTGCAAPDTSSAPDPECHLLSCGWIREENTPAPALVDLKSSRIRLEIHVRSKEERETDLVSIGGGIVDHDLRHPYPREGQPQIDESRFRPDAWYSLPEHDGRQNPDQTSFLFMRGLTTAGVWANIPLAESMPFIEAVDEQIKKLGDAEIRDQITQLRERRAQEARERDAATPVPEPPLTAAEQAAAAQILIEDLDDPNLSLGARQKTLDGTRTHDRAVLRVFMGYKDRKTARSCARVWDNIKSLGRLGAPEALEPLAAILEADPTGDTSVPSMDEPSEAIQRRDAATAIGSIGAKESLPLLRKLAARKNEYFTVREALQQAVGEVERKKKE